MATPTDLGFIQPLKEAEEVRLDKALRKLKVHSLKKEQDANAIVTANSSAIEAAIFDSILTGTGAATLRFDDLAGVLAGAEAQLQRVSETPRRGKDSSGDQAQRQNDPPEPQRRAPVGATDEQRALAATATARLNSAAPSRPGDGIARRYIGASGIGEECVAALALSLRGFPNDKIDPQLLRIFRDGHRIEEQVVSDMRANGLDFEPLDPNTGKQWGFHFYGGHVRANLDGLGASSTVEIKSMNLEMFERFEGKGLEISHPEYVDQVQLGMGLSKRQQCLFVAYCKNNGRYLVEVVPFDEARFNQLLARASEAMFGKPVRIAKHKKEYRCTRCFKRSACWGGAAGPEVASRTDCSACKYAIPDAAGVDQAWLCTLKGGPATTKCNDFSIFKVIPIGQA